MVAVFEIGGVRMTSVIRNLYSVQEFCQRNNMSRSGLYNLLRDGKLKAVKIGARTMIPAEAERAFLDSLLAA